MKYGVWAGKTRCCLTDLTAVPGFFLRRVPEGNLWSGDELTPERQLHSSCCISFAREGIASSPAGVMSSSHDSDVKKGSSGGDDDARGSDHVIVVSRCMVIRPACTAGPWRDLRSCWSTRLGFCMFGVDWCNHRL
jgi:hypothetical protein